MNKFNEIIRIGITGFMVLTTGKMVLSEMDSPPKRQYQRVFNRKISKPRKSTPTARRSFNKPQQSVAERRHPVNIRKNKNIEEPVNTQLATSPKAKPKVEKKKIQDLKETVASTSKGNVMNLPSSFQLPHLDLPQSSLFEKMEAIDPQTLEDWVAYQQQFGNETLEIQLPDGPVFNRINDDWSATIALQDEAEFWLMAPNPAMDSVKEEELFPLFLSLYSSSPYQLLDFSIVLEAGNPVLELVSLNNETQKVENSKVVVTEENFYYLASKAPNGAQLDPSLFLESLKILP